jgi:MscS family membrane protein
MLHKFLCFLLPFFSLIGSAQNTGTASQKVDLTSPYGTIYTHLYFLQNDSYQPEIAAQVFRHQNIDSLETIKVAKRLKQIYDAQGLYIDIDQLPKDNNYIDSISGQAIFVVFPKELPNITVEKIGNSWYYSSSSISVIDQVYKEMYPLGSEVFAEILPSEIGTKKIAGLFLWQLLGIGIILLVTWLFHLLLSRILRPIITRISRLEAKTNLDNQVFIWKIARLLSIWLIIKLDKVLLPMLLLPVGISSIVVISLKIIGILLLMFVFLNILQIFVAYGILITERTDSKLDDQLVPIAEKVLKGLIIIAAFISILQVLDVNITALIAGLSIGGLAVALAAQDTIKNLFGSLTIFLDRPFQIGDWIRFSGVDGSVEQVGLRSARIRTFDNSLVYIPNGKLADMVIDNFGLRNYRRFKTNISLTYDTPPTLIQKFVEGLRVIVENHPATRKDYIEIHLNEMSAYSLDILFYIYFDVPTYSKELESRHQIIMAILELGQLLGIRFAFPSSTMYIEDFPEKKTKIPDYLNELKTAEDKLNKWITQYKSKIKES